MPASQLPKFGLYLGWALKENGWKDGMDSNIKKINYLLQATFGGFTASLPGSPAQGETWILSTDKTVRVYDGAIWINYGKQEGWELYSLDDGEFYKFDGTDWVLTVASFDPSAYGSTNGGSGKSGKFPRGNTAGILDSSWLPMGSQLFPAYPNSGAFEAAYAAAFGFPVSEGVGFYDTSFGYIRVHNALSGYTDFNPNLAIADGALTTAKIQDKVELVILPSFDFNGNGSPMAFPQFPWGSPVKLTNPSTLPTANGLAAEFSPNGEYLVIGHQTSPRMSIYQRNGIEFVKIADPATLPTANVVGASWTKDGQFLAVSQDATSPLIEIYQRVSSVFTKLTNPATLPTSATGGLAFSGNGEFLAVAVNSTPFLIIYQRSNTTFTKLSDPATLPTGQGNAISFSHGGRFLAVAHNVSPFITIYERTAGNTFTKLSNPSSLASASGVCCKFSPNGQYLALGYAGGNRILIYQRSGTTFTKLADPATLPGGTVNALAWSQDSKMLAVGCGVSPYILFYSVIGTAITKLPDPGTLPTSGAAGVSFSPDSQFLAAALSSTPYMALYQTGLDMPAESYLVLKGTNRAGT